MRVFVKYQRCIAELSSKEMMKRENLRLLRYRLSDKHVNTVTIVAVSKMILIEI